LGTNGSHSKLAILERLRLKVALKAFSNVENHVAARSSLHAARTQQQQQVNIHETFFMS
jgi:hypothetical protein